MIVDRLENASHYYGLGERFQTAFEYLQTTDFATLEEGEYPISGKEIYVVLARRPARDRSKAQFEAHRRFADIQYMVEACDLMGYATVDEMEVTREYDSEDDAFLGNADGDFLRAAPGLFFLFNPQDAHMPSIKGNNTDPETLKAIVKVLLD